MTKLDESEIERTLRGIFQKYLNQSIPLEKDRNFFDLGLDSLMILKISGEIAQTFALEISPVVFFEHTNLEDLVRYLATAVNNCASDDAA